MATVPSVTTPARRAQAQDQISASPATLRTIFRTGSTTSNTPPRVWNHAREDSPKSMKCVRSTALLASICRPPPLLFLARVRYTLTIACPSDLSGATTQAEKNDILTSCDITLTTAQSDEIFNDVGTQTYTTISTEVNSGSTAVINNSTLLVNLTVNTALNTAGAVNREDGNVVTRKDSVPNL